MELANCVLFHCDLRHADMVGAEFVDTEFRRSKFAFHGVAICTFRRCDFRRCEFIKASFAGIKLLNCNFRECDATASNFERADLSGTDVRQSSFRDSDFRFTRMVGVRGLFGEGAAATAGVKFGDWAVYRKKYDYVSWVHLRSIAAFRLFGVSYLLLLLILLYAAIISAYNRYIAQNPNAIAWLDPAPRVSPSVELGYTLGAVFLLAAGATVFELLCPAPVKEASEIRWTHELQRSIVEYRSASWTYGSMGLRNWCGWRYICFVMYVTGGLWTAGYLIYRVYISMLYLLAN